MNFNRLVQLSFLVLLQGCVNIPGGLWVNHENLVSERLIQSGIPKELVYESARGYTKHLVLHKGKYITNIGDEMIVRNFKVIPGRNIREISELDGQNFFAIRFVFEPSITQFFERKQLDPRSRIFVFEDYNGKEILVEYLVMRHEDQIVDLFGVEAVWFPAHFETITTDESP